MRIRPRIIIPRTSLRVSAGTRIGVFEVIAPIGEGGMGQVWRANDTTLGREVALKFLPPAFSSDPDRVMRFQREAKTLASLNHSHIAQIYGFEQSDDGSALVMELVEGEDLSRRIARGAIPIEEALPIARQICAALEAAHEHGIIHRDLKPANIKVRSDGTVKVLDFGLAKLGAGGAIGAAGATGAGPTVMSPAGSAPGMILGTAAYMSPEQAKGKVVDQRADIWAFGCVLFEMLTGRAAYGGETVTDVLARVIEREPDWTLLDRDTPANLRRVLHRCLQKDVARRQQHIADARLDLDDNTTADRTVVRPTVRLHVAYAAIILTLGLIIVSILALNRAPLVSPAPVSNLDLVLARGDDLFARAGSLAISNDGTQIAYVASRNGVRQLYLRDLGERNAVALKGTEFAVYASFSQDGRKIAFVNVDRTLNVLTLADGAISPIGSSGSTGADYSSPEWDDDGSIVYSKDGVLWRMSGDGTPRQLTTLDAERKELGHRQPAILPGGSILFTSFGGPSGFPRIEALIPDGTRRVVVENASTAFFARGHIIFSRGTELLMAAFDPGRLAMTETPRLMISGVETRVGYPLADVAANGTVLYLPSQPATARLVWVSRTGIETPINDIPRNYVGPRVSPDGTRVAVYVDDNSDSGWVQDLDRQTFTRVLSGTNDGYVSSASGWIVWTPKGDRMIFRTPTGMWSGSSSGGRPSQILGSGGTSFPNAIGPDGDTLAYSHNGGGTRGDIYVTSLTGKFAARPFLNTNASESNAQFSPDGRFIAYVSDESGRPEIYLREFPIGDRKWTVSTGGGSHLVWSRRGDTMFYRDRERHIVAVDVALTPTVRLSIPKILFEDRYTTSGYTTVANFDASPDGQRLAMIRDDGAVRLAVLSNYFDRRLPSQ